MGEKAATISFFLLRGLGREVRHWGDFTGQLENSHALFRVIPLEIAGAGALRSLKSPALITQYIRSLRKDYQRHGLENDIRILLGFSFGGMIAARWLTDFPDDFDGAILINTSARPSFPMARLRPSAMAKLLGIILTRDSYSREYKIARLVCNLANPGDLAQWWQEIAESAPVSRLNVLRQLCAAIRFTLPTEVKIPVLLLSSTNDAMVNPLCSQKIAQKWESKLLLHTRAGHDLTTDDPKWCKEQTTSWVFQLAPVIDKLHCTNGSG